MRRIMIWLTLFGTSIFTTSCGIDSNQLSAAQAFHDEAEKCMQEVRDTNVIYTESTHCLALEELSSAYYGSLSDPLSPPPKVELLFESGRVMAWMAVALSNERGANLNRLWPYASIEEKD